MANQTIHICDENSTFEKIFVGHCKCTGYCERFMTHRAVTHTQITLPYLTLNFNVLYFTTGIGEKTANHLQVFAPII